MATIFYIDGSNKSCTADQPDMTGRVLIDVGLPAGISILLLMNQVSALMDGLAQNPAMANAAVIKITLS